MQDNFLDTTQRFHNEFFGFMSFVSKKDKKLLVSGDLSDFYDEYTADTDSHKNEIRYIIDFIQESVTIGHSIYMDVRERIASSKFYTVNLEDAFIEQVPVKEYLMMKEYFVNPDSGNNILTLNFKPFYDKSPAVRDIKSIGSGVEYLNKFLSSQMFTDTDKWKEILFKFIQLHKYDSEQLILNDRIKTVAQLNENLDILMDRLSDMPDDKPFGELKFMMQELGFEKGLGKNVQEIYIAVKMLDNLLNSPDHDSLMQFISRIPMIFKIAIISVHGYFAQEGVLGMPDTGGQVVYILDQVKALEKTLMEVLERAGIKTLPKIIILTRLIPNAGNTKCSQRLEKVHGTKNAWILRVPFRENNKIVTDNWISRFEIYPYLEEFAEDSYIELMAEFGSRPDLIIGNYSDGNLVSYLLAKRFNVTQCCIAHALEKSKYLYSALYWKELEKYYHFSLQFTADLIAINSADFLITSSFQEIAGTQNSIGQYESYRHFTMPGFYRVENGDNPYHTKFNIVSPGVNEKIYFPYTKSEKRITDIQKSLNELLFENMEDADVVGKLANPELTPIFSMARLDKIKNLTALVRWYGESEEMRKISNLIIVAGKVDPNQTTDNEEKEQIHLMYELINRYNLHENLRWIGKLFRKHEAGEVYRIIADHKGIFVQPALFEGFGLTVLEAMVSGLPVFATKYGGPLEIIQNKKNGFHIDPVNDKQSTDVILNFINEINHDDKSWKEISRNGIKRVNDRYNWKLYTTRLLSLAKLYGFWKFSSDLAHADTDAYLDIIYHTLYRPRAKELLEEHNNRR